METHQAVDLLVMISLSSEQVQQLEEALVAHGFYFTRIAGGSLFLEVTLTLLVGIPADRLDELKLTVEECCQRRSRMLPIHLEAPDIQVQNFMIETETGGALLYTLPVEQFIQY